MLLTTVETLVGFLIIGLVWNIKAIVFYTLSRLTKPDMLFIHKYNKTYWTVAEPDVFLALPKSKTYSAWIYQEVEQNKWGYWSRVDQWHYYTTVEGRKEAEVLYGKVS